jgi:hypothetical protein
LNEQTSAAADLRLLEEAEKTCRFPNPSVHPNIFVPFIYG